MNLKLPIAENRIIRQLEFIGVNSLGEFDAKPLLNSIIFAIL